MKRREFIGLVGGAAVAASLPTRLLAAEKVPRIAFLGGNSAGPAPPAFAKEFEKLGYVDGKNINIEWRTDNGNLERLPEMAADLVRLNVDLIVAANSTAGHAARNATTTIPIVVITSHDGVGSGLYKSLARPGGNITGIDTMSPELDAKRVELMREILPQLSRLTVLYNPTYDGAKLHAETISAAAGKLNVAVRFAHVQSISDFDAAFAAILIARPDAMLTVSDPVIFYPNGRKRIADFEKEYGIPMIHEFKIFVQQGGLISYGPDIVEMFRRGASYADKILKGEKTGDIPVEQPTKFDLAINLKTANALGITIPNNLIVSANTVIE